MRLVENACIESGAVPIDTNGAGVTGDYVSMRDYDHLTIIIMQGAWAAGTPAVTLKQSSDVAATGEKALSFVWQWKKVALTGTVFTKTAVTSDTFNLDNAANTITVIEVDAESLDTSNGFDCVRLNIASPGANADLISVAYILTQPRYKGATLPDPKVD